MSPVSIGILPQEKIRERMLAIAAGKLMPSMEDPKIWFTSMKSLAEVLSDENRALLHTIRDRHPNSIAELAELTGRKPSNLSRTLKTMSHYGFVEMLKEERRVRPVVNNTE